MPDIDLDELKEVVDKHLVKQGLAEPQDRYFFYKKATDDTYDEIMDSEDEEPEEIEVAEEEPEEEEELPDEVPALEEPPTAPLIKKPVVKTTKKKPTEEVDEI